MKIIYRRIFSRLYLLLYFGLFVLFTPAIWFSLHTPFSLIDDYNSWYIVKSFASLPGVWSWISDLIAHVTQRFRPAWDLYNYVTWTFFRDNSALHHVARLVLLLLPIIFFYKTINLLWRANKSSINLPLFVFSCFFIFSSNQPEAQLGPQETLEVFFLSVLIYYFARFLIVSEGNILAKKGDYIILFLAFWLMLWSKEPSIAIGAVFLVFAFLLSANEGKRMIYLLPFVAIFIFSLVKIFLLYKAGGYGVTAVTPELILNNSTWYLASIFQWFVSPVFTVFMAACLFGGIVFIIYRRNRTMDVRHSQKYRLFIFKLREWILNHKEAAFYLFIVLSFLAIFIMTLTSWHIALRYAYPALYMLCFWVAMSIAQLQRLFINKFRWVAWFVVAFSSYFVLFNYSGFIYQFAVQSLTRSNEQSMLQGATQLLDQGGKITVAITSEYEEKIRDYFYSFMPYYHNKQFPNIKFVSPSIVQSSLVLKGAYYLTQSQYAPAGHSLYESFLTEKISPLLDLSRLISKHFWLGAAPPLLIDGGVFKLGTVNWYIYRNEAGNLFSAPFELLKRADQNIVVSSSNEVSEYQIPIEQSFSKGEYYQIFIQYSIQGDAVPHVILIDQPFSPDQFYVDEILPPGTGTHTATINFQPQNGNVFFPLLIFRNWSKTGTFTITEFELRHLLIP